MDTRLIRIRNSVDALSSEEEKALREAGELIKGGGLVAFPTETVYGLGGDALNPESARKIYAAKGRPSDNPLIIHISKLEDMGRITQEVTEEAACLAAAFWPGPMTMILKKSEEVPRETTGGLDTVAIRMPSDPVARKLIDYSGSYVAAPSANLSGKPSPTAAKYVVEDMMGRIDAIIDGGEGRIGLESTIVDLTVVPPKILRPGYITKEMLENALGKCVDIDVTIMRGDIGQAPKAPGMKYRHYAPKGVLTLVEGEAEAVIAYINEQTKRDREAGEKVGVIGTSEQIMAYRADVVKSVGSRLDEESIAHRLYAILREFDNEGVTRIYSESFDWEGFGQAIMNRLLKAAGHRVVTL